MQSVGSDSAQLPDIYKLTKSLGSYLNHALTKYQCVTLINFPKFASRFLRIIFVPHWMQYGTNIILKNLEVPEHFHEPVPYVDNG